MIHLHTHSRFSIGDALPSPMDIAKAASGGIVALTDHNTLAGFVEHQIACEKHDVTPIFGVELDLVETRLTLLIQNSVGYKNAIHLVRMVERTYDDLREFSDGLICLTGDLKSATSQAILRKDVASLNSHIKTLQSIFGDRLYLEKIDNGLPEQSEVLFFIDKLSASTGIKSVQTNDVHYLSPDDASAQVALMSDRLNRAISPYAIENVRENGAWLKDIDDPVAMEIAGRCNFRLKIYPEKPMLPEFVAEGFSTSAEYLWHQCLIGLKSRFPGGVSDVYKERLKYEYDVICSMGFAGYFLIVWDFVNFAHQTGIPVGPGRGSGAGSLVAYLLSITDLDPVEYDLLFERFLNPDRVSMPDFDIDFCIERRDEVFEHVKGVYGTDYVAGISTYGENKPRSAWKAMAKLFGVNHGRANSISKRHLPDPAHDRRSIQDCIEDGSLNDVLDEYPHYMQIFNLASRIEGTFKSVGKHAGGVIISDRPIEKCAPIRGDEDGIFDHAVEFQMSDADKMGLVKFDFLGVAELTVLDRVSRQVGVDMNALPLDDREAFELISSGNTLGVFQLGSEGFSHMMMDMKPWKFSHIISAVALYRPGPKNAGMIDRFIERMHEREEIEYIHDDLISTLGETYGVILFQEQVMRIAQDMANYTLGQADILRRAMGKKDRKTLESEMPKFLQGIRDNGYAVEVGERLWDQIETFAEYGFNKAHSAGYAMIAYRTAYFKAHFPAEFIAAQMHVRRNNVDKLNLLIDNAHSMGLRVVEPDVNVSPTECYGEGDTIYVGLNTIRNIGDDVCRRIEFEQPFEGVSDFINRVSPGAGDLKNMTTAAAIDSIAGVKLMEDIQSARASLVGSASVIVNQLKKYSKQPTLFSAEEAGVSINLKSHDAWSPYEVLEKEFQSIGRYRTDHPARIARKRAPRLTATLGLWHEKGDDFSGKAFPILVVIKDSRVHLTKSGEEMAFLSVEDETGVDSVTVFPDDWKHNKISPSSMPVMIWVSPDEYEGEKKINFVSIKKMEDGKWS